MTYEEIAPLISGTGITKTAVENYFNNLPEPASAPEAPAITKTKVQAIADKLFGGEDFSISKLASEQDLNTSQVKAIIKELKALQAAYNANQED